MKIANCCTAACDASTRGTVILDAREGLVATVWRFDRGVQYLPFSICVAPMP